MFSDSISRDGFVAIILKILAWAIRNILYIGKGIENIKHISCQENYSLIIFLLQRVPQLVPGGLLLLKFSPQSCHTDSTGVGVATLNILLTGDECIFDTRHPHH